MDHLAPNSFDGVDGHTQQCNIFNIICLILPMSQNNEQYYES